MKAVATILVVDAHPAVLENLELALTAAGYQVLTASDGVKALSVLQSQSVDLVLTDITIPYMNGWQLYERVRENRQWLTIPFIFLTASELDSDIRCGKAPGVDGYLAKPIEPETLLAAVQDKLRRAE